MTIRMERHLITLIPDSEVEEVYLECFGWFENGKSIALTRQSPTYVRDPFNPGNEEQKSTYSFCLEAEPTDPEKDE